MSQKCTQLHSLFNNMEKHFFQDNYSEKIPQKGIYIMFEKGEKAHQADRIVRIGTHTGKYSLLKDRIREHFEGWRSVFRGKVGAAIINQSRLEGSSFWSEEDLIDWGKSWKKGFLRRQERFKNRGRIEQFEEANKLVNKYLRDNISFVCIEMTNLEERKYFESRLISTISNCKECQKSDSWLGNYSTRQKVRESGLWQEKELWEDDLTETDIDRLKHIVESNVI